MGNAIDQIKAADGCIYFINTETHSWQKICDVGAIELPVDVLNEYHARIESAKLLLAEDIVVKERN